MATFKRPLITAKNRVQFSGREVGLTHPDTDAYIKLCDNGNIEVVACEGLAFVLDRASMSANIFANNIRLNARTCRWNSLSFNQKATKYTEPAFVSFKLDNVPGLFEVPEV